MKSKIYILFFLLCSQFIFGQNNELFKIQTIIKTDIEVTNMIKHIDSLTDKTNFYEDEKYIVSSECRGEWGGAITFKNKVTKKEFICESTCPITVTKFRNKYIITNTLNHMLSKTQIIEIINPEKLEIKVKDKRYNFEKLGQQKAKILIETYYYSTLYSFVFDNKLYHIVSDKENTYIAEIINGAFKKVKDLSSSRFWTLRPIIYKSNETVMIGLNNFKDKAYIEIKENQIKLFTIK